MTTEPAEIREEALTFEKIMAMIHETAIVVRENAEAIKKDWEQAEKETKDLKERMKETDRLIGDLGNRFGELAEHLVAPNIMKKFNELDFNFTRCSLDLVIKEPDGPQIIAEVDIMLENGDTVVAVEVKAKPKQADVDKHAKRMEVLRHSATQRGDTRKYQGAVAGAIMSQSLRDYILKKGFYLIEQTGDTVRICIPEGFKIREW